MCTNQSKQFYLCGHCGTNACCVDCGDKIFERVHEYLGYKLAKCPKCNQSWEIRDGQKVNYVLNRAFRDLVESLNNIIPKDPAVGININIDPAVGINDSLNIPGSSNQARNENTPSPGRRVVSVNASVNGTPNIHHEEIIVDQNENLENFYRTF